jgi:hypothetical protein
LSKKLTSLAWSKLLGGLDHCNKKVKSIFKYLIKGRFSNNIDSYDHRLIAATLAMNNWVMGRIGQNNQLSPYLMPQQLCASNNSGSCFVIVDLGLKPYKNYKLIVWIQLKRLSDHWEAKSSSISTARLMLRIWCFWRTAVQHWERMNTENKCVYSVVCVDIPDNL